jgi:hypothetical protein
MVGVPLQQREKWTFIEGHAFPYLNGLRDGMNEDSVYPPDRIPFPKSKFAFEQFATQNGARTPHSVARFIGGKAYTSDSEEGQDLRTYVSSLPHGQYFCKPDGGSHGKGTFLLEVSAAGLKINRRRAELGQFLERFLGPVAAAPYLIQHSLIAEQHPGVARFNPDVLNTVRLTMFDTENGPVAISGLVRIGNGTMVVDNFSAGGIGVPIDLQRGFMTPIGLMHNDTKIAVHMKSGLTFGGQPVPLLKEAIALVSRLHARLAMRTLGWDIALLKDGPCVVEANPAWGFWVSAQLAPGYLGKFLRYHLPAEPDWTARYELAGSFRDFDLVRLWIAGLTGRSRVSARIDELTRDRVVVTVSGSRAGCDAAMQRLRSSAEGFDVHKLTAWRSSDKIRPGFDMSASFAPPDGRAAAAG